MTATLRAIWAEIVAPSKADEPAYYIMLIAIGHAMLGASLAPLDMAGWLALGRAAIPVAYWLIKERGDLRRGGGVADGLVDTGFVALGAAYAGQAWWPGAVLVAAASTSILFVAFRDMASSKEDL